MNHVIIWGKTKEEAIDKMNGILKAYPTFGGASLIKTQYKDCVYYKNGDILRAVGVEDSSKGHRCTYAFISCEISYDAIAYIIMPCIKIPDGLHVQDCFELY